MLLFPLGRLLATPGALSAVSGDEITEALGRHLRGDWGDVSGADRQRNNVAVRTGERLFSVFHTQSGQKFWIITERDRSATTVLLPEEY